MNVDCEECAGCCVDWRAIAPDPSDHERRGPRQPLDGVYNLVPLTRDDVRAFVDAGLTDALTPRLFIAGPDDDGVTVDGFDLASIHGRPAFFVGLRKPPKPVAPFGREDATWLPACVFLDPTNLQCRIHDGDLYPEECASYPGHNLALDRETECERVETAFGGERLLDAEPPDGLDSLLLGPQAVGAKVFAHPDRARIAGAVERIAAGEPTDDDRAEFVATAAAHAPGAVEVNEGAYESTLEAALAADSWAGAAIDDWTERAGDPGESASDPSVATRLEDDRGAPSTPGWDAVDG